MGFFSNLFEGPGTKVEKIIEDIIQNVEQKFIQNNSNSIEHDYCKVKICLSDIGKEWIAFETILRIFRKLNTTGHLEEFRDFNRKSEGAEITIYSNVIKQEIHIETSLYNENRYITACIPLSLNIN